ncbi:MAG: CAP domain-containing protein [Deltaproteobacteria bacterium]|nr:CAP domain-containing protein [Deltaproteobacteria bacterium]MBW2362226.1 CAP domain-containing protein [Deltaproteobacteria bacterium]
MPRTLGQGMAFLLGFAAALIMSPLSIRVASADAPDSTDAVVEARLHAAVNAERARLHLIPLERVPELDAVARAHSRDMAGRGYLAHVNPEGLSPLDRIQSAGIDGFTLAAENAGLTDDGEPSAEILRNWIASPVHADNLYAPPFNHTGIGIARSANGTWYVTQLYLTVAR